MAGHDELSLRGLFQAPENDSVMAGLRPGHPRLSCLDAPKTWMPGIADKFTQSAQGRLLWPGMTRGCARSRGEGALLHRPLPGPRSAGRGVLEATPGGFDFGLGGAVTARPCLGGIGREFGDVKPDDGTGCAVNQSGALAGFRRRSQPKANGSNASPA